MFILASKETPYSVTLFNNIVGNRKHESWLFVNNKDTLVSVIKQNTIDKIFFLHWSYIVPKAIYDTYECINIHTSNLPDGKGGSPMDKKYFINSILFYYADQCIFIINK